jgi:citrate synthase
MALCQRLGKSLPINLAGMVAAVYCELGFDPLEIEALAAVAYGFALTAHVVEEIKAGVPLRIIPEALGAKYAGPGERHIPDKR